MPVRPAWSARSALSRDLLDKTFAENNLVALVGPSTGPASIVDPVNSPRGTGSYSTLPAVSGYPHLTLPMGFVSGLPVGISFLGPAWSEAKLLSLGYAFEQATHARQDPPFLPNLAARPEIARAFDPPRSAKPAAAPLCPALSSPQFGEKLERRVEGVSPLARLWNKSGKPVDAFGAASSSAGNEPPPCSLRHLRASRTEGVDVCSTSLRRNLRP